MKTATQILTEARDLIAQGRWYQGDFTDFDTFGTPNQCFCALGAIAYVSEDDFVQQATADEDGIAMHFELAFFHDSLPSVASKLLRDAMGDTVPDWNDAPGRTSDEVVAAFNRAIELSKEPA